MDIQSYSVCVDARCPNACKFCVSRMNDQPDNTYENFFQKACPGPERDRYRKRYMKNMEFARSNGCNTVLYTSSGEALTNRGFIADVADINRRLKSPFLWVECQASGILIDDEMLRFLRDDADVDVLAISLADLFSSANNAEIMQIPEALRYNIDDLCGLVNSYGFTLRLCLNMSDVYNDMPPEEIFLRAEALGAKQLTFRDLYVSDYYLGSPQAKWIEEHRFVRPNPLEGFPEGKYYDTNGLRDVEKYIVAKGRKLERMPYGARRFSVHNISTVVDVDCMNKGTNKEEKDDGVLKYLVGRQDCGIYTQWDVKGSRLF